MGFFGSAPEKKEEKPKKAAAPAAVEAAPAASNNDIIAVIAAAVAACGYSATQIACISRLGGGASWTSYSRVEAVTVRKEMF